MKKKTHRLSLLVLLCFLGIQSVYSQLSILDASLVSYNITPQSLCGVTIMNGAAPTQAVMEVVLLDATQQPLLKITTSPFNLKKGLNPPGSLKISVQSASYGSSAQSQYIQSNHVLPPGGFSCCYSIKTLSLHEALNDEYCEEIDAELQGFLYLANPLDEEEIETRTPLFLWNHSEPFNLLAPNENYRMILVELKENQQAGAGILANPPVFVKTSLSTHQVPYPYDAKELETGKRYGWQVQQVRDGIITNQSEAWEFKIKAPTTSTENKYAVLKKTIDAGYYTAGNNKIFFRFEEEYTSNKLEFTIYDSERREVKAKAKNEDIKTGNVEYKNNGFNRFEIDLNQTDIKSGFHTLEVKNEKNELFLLKFYVE